jgi:hypothetical protein
MKRSIFATTILILFLSSKASADLMGKPSGALVGNKHSKYSSMHEKMTDCEQRSDNRWRLRKYPIRLKTYNFKNEFYSPFNNLGGSSCKAGFKQRFNGTITINTKLPLIIDAKGGGDYGHTDNDRQVALYWWSIATSHAVYDPQSEASNRIRSMLMHWAQSDALSKNIQASYGSRPVEYEVLVMISRIVETVAALGPAIQEDERNVVGPWLQGLVKKAEKSKWLSRQDNKQYLVDYILALWSVTNGDFKAIEQLARNYKHSIHDMRKDGSIVQESVRGGSSLQYQATAIQLMMKQAALIKNVDGVDIGKYRAEGNRSLSDAINFVAAGSQKPKSFTKMYARQCAASWGSIDNPNMNWRRWALKPILEYVNYEHKSFGIKYTASQVPGSSEYATTGNIKCMYTE